MVLAAFNRTEEMYGIASPLKGLKKPKAEPRLHSFSEEEEKALYAATEECFRNFLFVAIHTGLRPFLPRIGEARLMEPRILRRGDRAELRALHKSRYTQQLRKFTRKIELGIVVSTTIPNSIIPGNFPLCQHE